MQRVFICSTQVDLSEERQSVINAILRLKLQHDSMEYFGAHPEQPLDICLERVRKSDLVVVIVGHMYGSTVPSIGLSYSEVEYDAAFRAGKPCLVYFKSEDVPVLPKYMERDQDKYPMLQKFKQKLKSQHTIAYFR